jgi:hypothetical protein
MRGINACFAAGSGASHNLIHLNLSAAELFASFRHFCYAAQPCPTFVRRDGGKTLLWWGARAATVHDVRRGVVEPSAADAHHDTTSPHTNIHKHTETPTRLRDGRPDVGRPLPTIPTD